jgi:hypothetical protein
VYRVYLYTLCEYNGATCGGFICTPYANTMEQLADVLIMGVSTSVLHSALYKLGV